MHDRIIPKLQIVFRQHEDNRPVHCYKCGNAHEVSALAQTSTCPFCGSHIDFKNIKIHSRSSCQVDTRGDLCIEKNAYLFCAKAICKNALLYGSISGSLHCEQNLTLAVSGTIAAKLTAHHIEIPKESHITCPFPIYAQSISIYGVLRANLFIDGTLTIHKKGVLEGSVAARSINVDPGGELIGSMQITPQKKESEAAGNEKTASPLRILRRPRWDTKKRIL